MEGKYKIKSNYGEYDHIFEQYDENKYTFHCAEDWMTISIGYDQDYKIKFIDPTNGPLISKGWNNGEIELVNILDTDNIVLFELREMPKE